MPNVERRMSNSGPEEALELRLQAQKVALLLIIEMAVHGGADGPAFV
jgi:hypothetical protein